MRFNFPVFWKIFCSFDGVDARLQLGAAFDAYFVGGIVGRQVACIASVSISEYDSGKLDFVCCGIACFDELIED